MAFQIDQSQCRFCGLCPDVCPVNAINEFGKYFIKTKNCISCGECARVCPAHAIHKYEQQEENGL